MIRVGVAGLGVVGGEAVRLLRGGAAGLSRRLGAEVRVEAVCDRRAGLKARRLGLPASIRLTGRWRDLARDPAIDIAVETMGGLENARGFVLESLKSGKRVVTANKRLLAHHWEEIFRLSEAVGRRVCFEASVAGGIPVLQAIHQSLAVDRIRRVLGILNGTTNFILTRMEATGEGLGPALAQAQRLGLAERDPSMDLEGTDAAHKVAVIASLVTGRWVKPSAVARDGILGVQAEDIRFSRSVLGRTLRLLGTIDIDWDLKPARLEAHVFPTLIPLSHPLAAVQGEYNAVMLQASSAGDLMFYGKGAGAGPAASAVAGDVYLLAQDILRDSAGAGPAVLWSDARAGAVAPADEAAAAFYLRLNVRDKPGALSRITGALGRRGISISQIHQDIPVPARDRRAGTAGAQEAAVVITTHPSRPRAMLSARRDILAIPGVARSHTLLRMLT